jgi:hypothetical protein
VKALWTHIHNFDLENNIFTGQRMVEINGYLTLGNFGNNAGQLTIAILE